MKKFIELSLLNIFLALFQTAFFLELFERANPNLVLAGSFAFFFGGATNEAMLSGLIGGLIVDLLGTDIIGITPLFIILTVLVSDLIRKYLFKGWVMNIISTAAASFLYTALVSYPRQVDTKYAIAGSLFTVVFSLVIYVVNKTYSRAVSGSSFNLK